MDRVALAMGLGIIRLLEAGAWDFRIAIGFVKKPGVARKQLSAVRTAVEPDQAIGSPPLAVGAVGSSCS